MGTAGPRYGDKVYDIIASMSAMTYMVQSSHCTSGVARIPHWGAGVPLPPPPLSLPFPSPPHFRSRPLKYS